MGKTVLKTEANNTSFSYQSLVKKWGKEISVPFLPKGYEKDAEKYVREGENSKYKNLTFEKVLRCTQPELKKYCRKVLRKFGYQVDCKGGFLYASGDIPILLIAHMDTVHKDIPSQIIYKDNYMTSPQGIGGDDRCGIYLILEIVKELKCHVLFTEDEEKGGIGAGFFAESKIAKNLKGKIKYCIELDRRGETDCVFYDCDNTNFIKFIESTGYFKENYGSFSDIGYIAPALDCSAVNLSSGYHDEHTKSEYIDLKAMKRIIKEVKKIINLPAERFEWIERERFWGKYGGKYSYYDDDEYWDTMSYNASFGIHDRENEYMICWEDFEKSTTYLACSEEEAIGMFLIDNPHLCYSDIRYIDIL